MECIFIYIWNHLEIRMSNPQMAICTWEKHENPLVQWRGHWFTLWRILTDAWRYVALEICQAAQVWCSWAAFMLHTLSSSRPEFNAIHWRLAAGFTTGTTMDHDLKNRNELILVVVETYYDSRITRAFCSEIWAWIQSLFRWRSSKHRRARKSSFARRVAGADDRAQGCPTGMLFRSESREGMIQHVSASYGWSIGKSQ